VKYFTIAPALRGSAAIAGTMKPVNQGVMTMTKYILAGAMALMSTAALAGEPKVPEMSAGAGVAAIALLVGVAAIIRERSKRK
jgi:hypothetical protein